MPPPPNPNSLVLVSERALPDAGGVAVSTTRIAEQAALRGEDVHVVCWSAKQSPGARHVSESGGVTYHRVGLNKQREAALTALADHARDVVLETGATLVHGLYATSGGYAAVLAAGELGVPSIVGVRGNDVDRGAFRAQDLPFLRTALERATVVSAVSRALARRVRAISGRDVPVIANSVDSERFKPEAPDNSLRAALGLGEARVLGFSGELREKKGMRYLLPAFNELVRKRDVRLLLIGGVRADAREAWDEFRRLSPEAAARIKLLDYVRSPKRISRLLALCDALVFPSLQEGLPNAVLEAMAAGRLVLASEAGGHPDLIEHGEHGLLLPLSELDRLPEALEELLDLDADERRAIGARARARVRSEFTPQRESEAYAALYTELRA